MNKKPYKPCNKLGKRITLGVFITFIISFIPIKAIPYIYNNALSSGDILSYIGCIMTAIAAGVLSYLMYQNEKRSLLLDEEKKHPMLCVTEFYGSEAKVADVVQRSPNTLSTIVTEGSSCFSYGIYLTNDEVTSVDNQCARQYIFHFKFSGEILCTRITINKIVFTHAENPSANKVFSLNGQKNIFDAFKNGNMYVLYLYCLCSTQDTLDWDILLDITLETLIGDKYSQKICARKFMADESKKIELLCTVEYNMR